MERYGRCIRKWDEVFAAEAPDVPQSAESGNATLDAAFDWLAEKAQDVLDFGCGNGVALFYCALRGTSRHTGIDLSARAIESARLRAEKMPCGAYRFLCGGVEAMEQVPDESMDAAIFSNILDNLYPDDARRALCQARRILRPGARALIKLNPYITREQQAAWGVRTIEDDLLDDGLLLWNNTDERWREVIGERLEIVQEYDVFYAGYDQHNRLFLAEKR